MGFRECCCCCCSPKRVAPAEKFLNDKQKQIIEYVGDGVMVDEIYDYIVTQKKKKSKFRFRGLGRIAGRGGFGSEDEPEPEPQIRGRTFRQAGRATQMGVIANSKKKSAIEEDDDSPERPKKKWTFKSVGKVTRLQSSMPRRRNRIAWTFKRVANFFRYGPKAPENAELAEAIEENLEEAEKKKWTLKSLGKMSRMGGFKNESIEKPKQKFTLKGLGKMSKLGMFKNESIEKPKQKFTLKGLGKMSKLGLFKNESVEKPQQKWSIKSLGKLSNKLGFGGSKQQASIEEAPKRRKTLKSFGKGALLGAKAKNPRKNTNPPPKQQPQPVKKKRKFTFRGIGKLSKMGIAVTNSNRPRMKRKKKPTFRFLARFSRFGAKGEEVCTCGEDAEDLYECTCPSSDED